MSVLLNLNNENVKEGEVRNNTFVSDEKLDQLLILGINKDGFVLEDIEKLELIIGKKIRFIDSSIDREKNSFKNEKFDVIGYAFKKGAFLDYLSWVLEIEESPNVFLLIDKNGQKVWAQVLAYLKDEDRYEVKIL